MASAFARCRGFLDYHPLAKWLSIVASALTAILYLGLIIVLGFFIDLMIERGNIPAFTGMPAHARQHFLDEMASADPERRTQVLAELKSLDADTPRFKAWADGEAIEDWTPRERAFLWRADLLRFIDAKVPDASDLVREKCRNGRQQFGPDAAFHDLPNCGFLSQVVRWRYRFGGRLLAGIADWAPSTWSEGDGPFLLELFFWALGLAIVRLVTAFLSRYMGGVAVLEAVTRLRRSVYLQTNRLGTLAIRDLGPSEAVSVSTRHLEVVHDGLYQWLTVYFREPVKFGLLVAFTLVVNFWLALAFLLFALLVWLVGGQIAVYFRRQGRNAEMRAAEQLVLVQESLTLMRLIKIYLMESFNQTRVERQLSAYARAQLTRYRAEAIYRPLFFFLGLAAALVLLLVAGYVILDEQIGVTSVLILIAAIISLYWPIIIYLEARRVVRRSRQSARALFDFLDRQGGVGQAIEAEFIPAMTRMIQFDKVTLRDASTGRKLLSNISFIVKAGEKVAIVGPDEREVQALVYLLPRFLDPTGGEVRIDGKNLRWVTLDSLRAQIAMVLRHNLIFNDTIANNIGCGDPAYNLQRVTEAAKIAHAHQFIAKLPHGYETVIGETGHPLSIGEKFRVALARAILRDPAILVIEEPVEPLDDDTKGMIDDTLQRVTPGRTVIFLPHRLTTIRGCDQVFLIYQGKIEASGEHRELLNTSELYRHLQYMEFNEFAGVVAPAAPKNGEAVGE